jgi:hypothetical protein
MSLQPTLPPYSWRRDPLFTSAAAVIDHAFQTNVTALNVTWEPFRDAESGVIAMGYCIGQAPYRCDTVNWTSIEPSGTVTYMQMTELPLTAGTKYYTTVTAVNAVGLASSISSNGILVDNRAPSVGLVWDGPVQPGNEAIDLDCDVFGTPLAASWYGFASQIGIDFYEWGVGTAPGFDDVLPFTNVGLTVAASNSSVLPPPGVIIYSSVRATNFVGLMTLASSNGIMYVCPEPGSYDTSALPAAASAACSGSQSQGAERERGFLCIAAPADVSTQTTVTGPSLALLKNGTQVSWV